MSEHTIFELSFADRSRISMCNEAVRAGNMDRQHADAIIASIVASAAVKDAER